MYYNKVKMKKIISLLICIQLGFLPAFADYDFSDEAQAEFDRQQQQIMYPSDFNKTKSRSKSELRKKDTEEKERTEYVPAPDLLYSPSEEVQLAQPDLLKDAEKYQLAPVSSEQKPLYGAIVKVPAGTSFEVTFDSGVSSGSMAKDDRLTVRLTNDLMYNGQVIAPSGSLVYGTATDARNAGYAYGSGAVELDFNQILTPEGTMLNISTKKIVMKAKSERAQKMTRDIVVGTLGSLLVGAAFTALGGSHDWGRNMLIYGGIGAVGGGIHGAMQRGEEISIPDGTTIKVTLTDTLTASPYSF